MAIPKDANLYNKIKAQIYREIPQHSAYRSGQIVKRYKSAYLRMHGSKNAYEGKKNNVGLTRWYKEKWQTQDGKDEYQKKGDVFRPTVKVNSKTPKTFSELSNAEIQRAMKEKKQRGRVKKF